MSIGIYKIENLINNKIYIGQSIHIENRWQEHCRASSESLISKAIRKYGKENFSFQILEETQNLTKLNDLEANYIKQYNSLAPNGYNIVMIDSREHHQFNKYDNETFNQIIYDIKNTNLSFKDISKKYELDLSMIYYLNRGDYHTLPNETYPLRTVKDATKKIHYCPNCGIEVKTKGSYCITCANIRQRKVERPDRETLKVLIRSLPFIQIGKQFNVSDNTIRKWCKIENLPYKVSEIKKILDEDWEKI